MFLFNYQQVNDGKTRELYWRVMEFYQGTEIQIGGYSPDYLGMDFGEAASKIIIKAMTDTLQHV